MTEMLTVPSSVCSLALGMVAAYAPLHFADQQQPLGLVPTTQWENNGLKLNTTARCTGFKI